MAATIDRKVMAFSLKSRRPAADDHACRADREISTAPQIRGMTQWQI
jgi:hypothetical protein